MSTERTDLDAGDPHGHFAPEDLLEFALEQLSGRLSSDPALARAHARARACSECSRALDTVLEDLERVRAAVGALSSVDAGRAARLAESAIASTTRENLSWRGDWRVVGRFLRERWRASVAVRVVAASLFLHLLALPVLAIVLVFQVQDSPTFWTSIEPPLEDLPVMEDSSEPRRELVREPEPDVPDPISNQIELSGRNDRLAWARRELLAAGAPQLAAPGPAGEQADALLARVARLLVARSHRLRLGELDATLAEPAADATWLERALWVELLLDDWSLSGRADARLSVALRSLSGADEPGTDVSRAELELVRHALERAASYGSELAGISGGLAPRSAFPRAWFDALEQACSARGAIDSTGPLAAWLAWGRDHAR